MFNLDEKYLFPPVDGEHKPPHCPPHGRPYTLTEQMDDTVRDVRATIDRLLRFEERLEKKFEDMLKNITSDNVIFKNTFTDAYRNFLEGVKNEINVFENNVNSTMKFFQTDVESNYANLSDDVRRQVADCLAKTKAQFENAYEALKNDFIVNLRGFLGEMKENGELENILNEELEIHVKNDYYNVTPTTVLATAVEYCKAHNKAFYVPYGVTIPVSSTLDLTGIDVHVCGTLRVTCHGVGILVGENELRTSNIYIREVTAPNYIDGDISVRVVGVKRARVTIDFAPTIQLYANGDVEGRDSIAYSVFNVLSCRKFMIYDEPNTNAQGWINENTFHVERVTEELSIVGNTYQHNNNVFYKPCVEGASLILRNCRRNKFYDIRNENVDAINLDSNTWQNVILFNYHTTIIYNRGNNFVDNGRDNVVECAVWQNNKYVPIYTATPKSIEKGLYEIADSEYFNVADGKITPTDTYKNVVDGVIIPAKYINRIRATTDTGCIRIRVALLDADKNPITAGGKFGGQNCLHPVYYYGVSESNVIMGDDGLYNPQTSAVAQTVDILNKNAEFIKITVQVAERTTPFKYLILLVGCNERDSAHLEYLKYELMH